MKRNDNYIKDTINGKVTLVPFAAEITEQRSSVSLNGPAEYLWDLLAEESSFEDLEAAYSGKYGPQSADDLRIAVAMWTARGLIIREPSELTDNLRGECFKIAGIGLQLCTSDDLIPTELKPYSEGPLSPDLKVALIPGLPPASDNGRILINNPAALITESEHSYRMLYPDLKYVRDCILAKDGSSAVIYHTSGDKENLRQEIFQVLRVFYSLTALKKGLIFLHSASILYKEKLWLFSAHSGGGKSSHVALWQKEGAGVQINGDLNLIDAVSSRVYGTPWCGTSTVSSGATHDLGGICMLRKSKVNSVSSTDKETAGLRIMNRTVSPTWNRETAEACLKLSGMISDHIPLWELECDLSKDAFLVSKAHIDSLL